MKLTDCCPVAYGHASVNVAEVSPALGAAVKREVDSIFVSQVADLVGLGVSFDRAERMSAHDRQVWIIALGQKKGGIPFDFDHWRWPDPPKQR